MILNFQVSTYDGSATVAVTSNYIRMSSGCTRGSYMDLPVRRLARVVYVWLSATSGQVFAGLQEFEIFVDGRQVWDR